MPVVIPTDDSSAPARSRIGPPRAQPRVSDGSHGSGAAPAPSPNVPAIEAGRGTGVLNIASPRSSTLQPRLMFSTPYSAAFGVFCTPGGKWMPLMNRTVRDDSGAWSLANIAPARAAVTAMSGARSSACGRAYTPTIAPVRSTTAAASVSLSRAPAATFSTASASSAVRICAAPPALSAGRFWESRDAQSADAQRNAEAARARRMGRPCYPFRP